MSKPAFYTINPLLKAYRWVAEGKEPVSDTQRMVLEVKEKQPAKFLAEWKDLEKKHMDSLVRSRELQAQEKMGVRPTESGPDDGEERCIELCERWLKENAGVDA